MAQIVIALPVGPGDYMANYQKGLETVFGNSWRVVLASIIAFWCGSFTNAYVMAKMKVWTEGKHLWSRTIGSTVAGELVDSSLFYIIAFYAIWDINDIVKVAVAQYILKTSWEIVATPMTYAVVNFLKRKENEDYFDTNTNFTPFRLKVDS
jgi:uncharacterized integral membrane protein (TIGR00697 family)